MHDGNPKLICHDEICIKCNKFCPQVVQELPRMPSAFMCDECTETMYERMNSDREMYFEERKKKFDDDIAYLAQVSNHKNITQNYEFVKSLLPSGWMLYHHNDSLMVFDSENVTDGNKNLPVNLRYWHNERFLFSLSTGPIDDPYFKTEDDCRLYDLVRMVAQAHRYVSENPRKV